MQYLVGLLMFLTASEDKHPSLRSFMGNGKEGVELISSVKKKDGGYEYTYTIRNTGKEKTWLVGFTAIDVANKRECYYLLTPGETVVVKTTHKNPPIEDWGKIKCFIKKHGHFAFQMSGGTSAWVPKKNDE